MSPRKQTRAKRPALITRRKRTIKSPSRIPGVYVGETVETSIGAKKKVCFNTGGGWAFRMVKPEWRVPGRPKKRQARSSKLKAKRPDDSDD